MFKTETHIHTQEVSHCGRLGAREIVRKYKEAGYSTIFITDHLQTNTIVGFGDIDWKDKVEKFLHGYYVAKDEGDKIGVNVLLGAEIGLVGLPNHYLAYGITKEFLEKHPNIHTYDIEKFYNVARENWVLIVQAHPYRDGSCFPTPDFIDGVEVYNSNPRHHDFSEKSQALAKEHNLFVIGGSDTHREEDVALSGIETDVEIKSVEEFIELVKSGNVKIIRG